MAPVLTVRTTQPKHGVVVSYDLRDPKRILITPQRSNKAEVFAIFSRSSRSRSAESSSAELVLAISSLQRRTRNKKQSIPPIPDFASEKSQRRVSVLKNRVGELRSEIKAATANEAKQITESMKRKWFRGTVIEIDPPPPPPNFAVKKHLRSKLPRKIFDDYSSAYSELQSDILQESSDLDFSKYSPSVWSTYALEHSPFLEEHNSYDEISLVLEEEDGERYRMLRNIERRQVYGDLVVQKRLQMVHWTVQQSTKNELQKETMFLGVNLFDQFLTKGLFDQVEQSSQQKPNSSEFDGQQDGEISQNDQSVCSETSSLNCSIADQEAVVETIAIVTHEKAKENETLARLTSEVSSLKEMKRQRLQKLQDLDEVLSKVIELTEVEVKSQNELEEIYRSAHMDTSGSTELPKGVVITHGNFVAILVAVMTVIPNFGTNDVYVAAEIVMMAGDASIGYSLALTLTDASNKTKKGTQGDASVLKPALMTGGLYFSNLQKVFKVIGNSVALNSSYGSAEEVACDKRFVVGCKALFGDSRVAHHQDLLRAEPYSEYRPVFVGHVGQDFEGGSRGSEEVEMADYRPRAAGFGWFLGRPFVKYEVVDKSDD
nr:long-chain acyl-CoA synthetase 8 [Ipomoea batatas]